MLPRLLCGISNYLHPNRVFTVATSSYWVVLFSRISEPVACQTQGSVRLVAARIDVYLLYDARCINDFIARCHGKTHPRPDRS